MVHRPFMNSSLPPDSPGEPVRFVILSSSTSLRTVANFVQFLVAILREDYGESTVVVAHDAPGEVEIASRSVVFAFGQSLAPFSTSRTAYVVFLNFSVLYHVSWWPFPSLRSMKLIWEKRRRFLQRLASVDCILDFYPAHGQCLANRFPDKYAGLFPVALYASPVPYLPLASAKYDVCTIGSETPRRRRVWKALAARGLSLSPCRGVLEEIMPRCRVTLNIHAERYANCESHRILSSLAHGRPVISERIVGCASVASWQSVLQAGLARLADTTASLLSEPARAEALAREGYEFYWLQYWPAAREAWREIIRNVRERAFAKWSCGF